MLFSGQFSTKSSQQPLAHTHMCVYAFAKYIHVCAAQINLVHARLTSKFTHAHIPMTDSCREMCVFLVCWCCRRLQQHNVRCCPLLIYHTLSCTSLVSPSDYCCFCLCASKRLLSHIILRHFQISEAAQHRP